MRAGTPFQTDDPPCGEFINKFYGDSEGEGIDFKSLISFIKKVPSDHTLVYNWVAYAINPTVVTDTLTDAFISEDNTIIITNNIQFEYTDGENKKVTTELSGNLTNASVILKIAFPSKKDITLILAMTMPLLRQH